MPSMIMNLKLLMGQFVELLMFLLELAHVVIGSLKTFHVLMRVRLYIGKIYVLLILCQHIIVKNTLLPPTRKMFSQFLMKATGSCLLMLKLLSLPFINVKLGDQKRRGIGRSMKNSTRTIKDVANVARMVITKGVA